MPTQGGGHIIIQSLLAHPDITSAEQQILTAMDSQPELCDHDVKWICKLVKRLLLA